MSFTRGHQPDNQIVFSYHLILRHSKFCGCEMIRNRVMLYGNSNIVFMLSTTMVSRGIHRAPASTPVVAIDTPRHRKGISDAPAVTEQ